MCWILRFRPRPSSVLTRDRIRRFANSWLIEDEASTGFHTRTAMIRPHLDLLAACSASSRQRCLGGEISPPQSICLFQIVHNLADVRLIDWCSVDLDHLGHL